jgi:hypothetical protein
VVVPFFKWIFGKKSACCASTMFSRRLATANH